MSPIFTIFLLLQFIICFGTKVNTRYHQSRQLITTDNNKFNALSDDAFDDIEFEIRRRRKLLLLDDAVNAIADAVVGALDGPLKPIKDGIEDLVNEIPFIDEIPTVLAQVNNIPTIMKEIPKLLNYVDEIPDMLLKVLDVKKLAEDIPKILEAIISFLQSPFGVNGIDDEIKAFADVLDNCIGSMTSLIDPVGVIDELFSFIDVSFLNLPEPEEIIYHALAFILLPFKPVITFICEDAIPTAIDWGKQLFKGDLFRRRLNNHIYNNSSNLYDDLFVNNHQRRLTDGNEPAGTYVTISTCQKCVKAEEEARIKKANGNFDDVSSDEWWEVYNEDLIMDDNGNEICKEYVDRHGKVRMNITLCNSEETAWLYDDPTAEDYINTVDRFDEKLITNFYDTSYTEYYVTLKIATTVLDVLVDVMDGVCEFADACIPDGEPWSCTKAGLCAGLEALIGLTANILNYVLDIAAVHDGEINNVKIDRIFKDRYVIIHNQKVMMEQMNMKFAEELETLRNGIIGITTQSEVASDLSKYNVKAVINKIDNSVYGLEAIKNIVDDIESEDHGLSAIKAVVEKIDDEQPNITTIQNIVTKIEQIETDNLGYDAIHNSLDDITSNTDFGLTAIKTVVDEINDKLPAGIDNAKTVHDGMISDGQLGSVGDNEVIVFELQTKDLYIGVAVFILLFMLQMGCTIFLTAVIILKCCNDKGDKYKYKTVQYDDSETEINE